MVKSRNLCDFSDGVRVECGVVKCGVGVVLYDRNLFINMVMVECGVVWLGELGKSWACDQEGRFK